MAEPGAKKPVVMEEDLGKPGGPATLDADGKLAESQRPDATGLKMENGATVEETLAGKANLDGGSTVAFSVGCDAGGLYIVTE